MLRIIISPAKKMNIIDEYDCKVTQPVFMEDAAHLHDILQGMSRESLKSLWQCSDKLTDQNYSRLHAHTPDSHLTPALLAYEGIQYQYMAPHIFSDSEWDYVTTHLNILSGFYGVLKPTDGVIPYRLEMQNKLKTRYAKDLYQFWKDKLYVELTQKKGILSTGYDKKHIQLLNLASAEYSKTVLPYVKPPITCVTCIFGEVLNGKVKVKGTQAKIARGEMVRWMAEHQIEEPEGIRSFDRLDYRFHPERSSDTEYVFVKI